MKTILILALFISLCACQDASTIILYVGPNYLPVNATNYQNLSINKKIILFYFIIFFQPPSFQISIKPASEKINVKSTCNQEWPIK